VLISAFSGHRVLVASDDGYLYCLAAADGRLIWKQRGGPRPDNYKDNSVPESESLGSATLPKSLYLKERPAWFGDLPWPPFASKYPTDTRNSSIRCVVFSCQGGRLKNPCG
jgi:hypothetical protein